jgi:hypothetical protein
MKSRKMAWAGHVVRMKGLITEHKILFGKAEGKKLFGRQEYRNDTKMILKKWKDMDWIYLPQAGDLR